MNRKQTPNILEFPQRHILELSEAEFRKLAVESILSLSADVTRLCELIMAAIPKGAANAS